jgi:phosphoribosylglycinamide formyltransferase-1
MRAIVDAVRERRLPAQVCAVISNRADAPGLDWARGRGIATRSISHRDYAARGDFDRDLSAIIDEYDPHYVLLAGFMRILTPEFVAAYHARLINIHPSLLPAFPGLHTHQKAIEAGVQWHGCTVHFVTPVLDQGPVLAQGAVPVLAGDTPDTLADRVLQLEHSLYAGVTQWLSEGRVELDDTMRVRVRGIATRSFVLAGNGVRVLGDSGVLGAGGVVGANDAEGVL